MRDLAERDIQQEKGGHKEEYPHPTSIRAALNPQGHCDKTHGEEYRHQRDGEEIIRAAYDTNLRDRQTSVYPAKTDQEREPHEQHEDLGYHWGHHHWH